MAIDILLLCAGNLCRSPMAEGLLRQQLPAHELFSAGLCAREGEPADPMAIALMAELGIDISAHRARALCGWMMREAELVLTMDERQRALVQQRYPSFARKVERLGEIAGLDIPDPYRRGLPAFRHSLQLMQLALRQRLPQFSAAESGVPD